MNLFDLNEPHDLYRIIIETYVEYASNPTEKDFLFLVFGFTHLREWIAVSSYEQIRDKQETGGPLTDGEQFFCEIYELPAFRIIQSLCNRSKHHITRHTDLETSKLSGFHVGLSCANDSIDQTYFLIDDIDSREYFNELVRKYNEWFTR